MKIKDTVFNKKIYYWEDQYLEPYEKDIPVIRDIIINHYEFEDFDNDESVSLGKLPIKVKINLVNETVFDSNMKPFTRYVEYKTSLLEELDEEYTRDKVVGKGPEEGKEYFIFPLTKEEILSKTKILDVQGYENYIYNLKPRWAKL